MASRTVQIDLTVQDLVDFQVAHVELGWDRKRKLRGWLFVSAILLIWATIAAIIFFRVQDPYDIAVAPIIWPLLLFPVLYLGLYLILTRCRKKLVSWTARNMLRKGRNLAVTGKMTVTLTDEGISQKGEFSETFVRSEAVEKIISSASAVYIYVSSHAALIFPRRSFSDDSDFRQFFEFAGNLYKDPMASTARAVAKIIGE